MAPVDPDLEQAVAETRRRLVAYPLGSGQAEEIALAAGLKPMVRQLLDDDHLGVAVDRFERSGFEVAVAPVRYVGAGAARRAFAPGQAPKGSQAPVFVGRERARVDAAAECELSPLDLQPRTMGALLGYPPCCIEAFATTPPPRPNKALAARALARTPGAPASRLNTLDQGVFHYVAYSPCSLRCAPSLEFADAVAALVAGRHPAFAAAIEAALGAHRLVVADDVQVSLTGRRSGDAIAMDRVWPTAQDRHPGAALGPKAEVAVAELVVALRRGKRLEAAKGGVGVAIDGRPLEAAAGAVLVPFGP